MHIEQDIKLDFKDVLIRPKRSTLRSRSEVDLLRTYTCKWSKKVITGVPIICANMDTVASLPMARALFQQNMLTALHKHYTVDELTAFFGEPESKLSFYSTGIGESDAKKLHKFMEHPNSANAVGVCIDVANGYTQYFVDFIRKIRDRYPNLTIMAGNVVTGDMTEELILSGADICKCGIGPGAACLTRRQTGVGYPQLSSIIECADAAHGLGGLLCGDGGITCTGDLAKAFGGGADFVMMGSMLAAHNECGGTIIERNGKKYMQFYGMSSSAAQDKHSGGVAEYRASEGRVTEIPLRGPVQCTLLELAGGLRSACTYVGARKLKELSRRTTFIRVSQQLNEMLNEHTTGK